MNSDLGIELSAADISTSAAKSLRVERIAGRHFRNLSSFDIEPGKHFNVIHGENGAGKSNLIETIYYLASLRSFRGAKAAELISIEEQQAQIKAKLSDVPISVTVGARLDRQKGRRIDIDGKRLSSVAKWVSRVPAVIFHPGDLALVSGSPEGRRTFLDRIVSQIDLGHDLRVREYTKALRSRNRMLKNESLQRDALRAFDEILIKRGVEIGVARQKLVDELGKMTESAFDEVIGEELAFDVAYQPRIEPDEDKLRAALEASFRKDRARGFTADGPHSDDLSLTMRGQQVKHHASQGQQRSMVLGLKVSELKLLEAKTGRVPLLLLDDVSSELDRTRNRRFFELLSKMGGQVFLTTTHPEFILIEENRTDFQVCQGVVT